MRRYRTLIGLILFGTLIVGAHIALWSSTTVPEEAKLRLTLLNAAGWGAVVLPAFAVNLWLRAHRRDQPRARRKPAADPFTARPPVARPRDKA